VSSDAHAISGVRHTICSENRGGGSQYSDTILDAQMRLSNTSGSVPPQRWPLLSTSQVSPEQSDVHEKVQVPTLKPPTKRPSHSMLGSPVSCCQTGHLATDQPPNVASEHAEGVIQGGIPLPQLAQLLPSAAPTLSAPRARRARQALRSRLRPVREARPHALGSYRPSIPFPHDFRSIFPGFSEDR